MDIFSIMVVFLVFLPAILLIAVVVMGYIDQMERENENEK